MSDLNMEGKINNKIPNVSRKILPFHSWPQWDL